MKKVCILGIATLLVISLLTWGLGPVMAQDKEFQRIDKPLSPVGGDDVHGIPPGSTIHHLDNGITKVYGPGGRHILTTKDSLESLIPVPQGVLARASHVHSVPSGSIVSKAGNDIRIYYEEACILTIVDDGNSAETTLPSLGESEWTDNAQTLGYSIHCHIEYAKDRDVDNLDYFKAYWSVPDSPPDPYYKCTDYIFNAIQTKYSGVEHQNILQSVLEWNYVRGSYEWTCATWVGLWGTYINGTRIDASEGDELYGRLRVTTGGWWEAKIRNMDTHESSYLYTDFDYFGDDNLVLYLDLESWNFYHLDDDMPGDILFHNMIFRDDERDDINITWRGYTPGKAWGLTGLKVRRYSDRKVKLYTAN